MVDKVCDGIDSSNGIIVTVVEIEKESEKRKTELRTKVVTKRNKDSLDNSLIKPKNNQGNTRTQRQGKN